MSRTRTEEELLAEARAVITRTGSASPSGLADQLKIGSRRAAALVQQLEAEGLVSRPGRGGRRNVRGSDGVLEQPEGKPWRPWEAVAAGWIGRLTGQRQGDDG